MAVCYRHPNRETGVSCANCGRPICPDCMTSTPVGMRCPECSKQTTKVRRAPSMAYARPTVTIALIAINVLIFIGTASQGATTGFGGSTVLDRYSLFGPLVASEPWRLVTSGFLHAGIIHVGFNMYILWFLGQQLEPVLGSVRFGALYAASLLSGAFGALLVSPEKFTVGASGAVFGLMGAMFVLQRARGIDPMQSGIGFIILINLGIGFVIPGISVGGHVGGLVGGAAAGWLLEEIGRRRLPQPVVLSVAACAVIAAAAVFGSFAVADGTGLGLNLGR